MVLNAINKSKDVRNLLMQFVPLHEEINLFAKAWFV